ncbi:MAG: 50S ribosomal protein L19 [Patescibacteria group bacterium]|nr:50S ribosomal protein L19 [Patescibacteria group bacterium]
MPTKIISPVNTEFRKKLDIRPGDTVRVWQKIEEEKGKTRLQAFEGLDLARKHGREAGATFTVRKVIDGIGVERIFPLYSPMIDEIEMVRRAKVRRAKLYFIREKASKEIKRQMRRIMEAKYEEETPAQTEASADDSSVNTDKNKTGAKPEKGPEQKPEVAETPKKE